MNKIKDKNTCEINDVTNYFKLSESTFNDHFGCKNHFIQWYNYNYSNGIYFFNPNKINKVQLSKFLNCNISIFDDFNYDSKNRHNYDLLKINFPLSYIMYKNIDQYINELSIYHNNKN
jgi:hypothetical protein